MFEYVVGVEGATKRSIAALFDLRAMKLIAETGAGVNFHCYGDLAYKNLSIMLRKVAAAAKLDIDVLRTPQTQLTLGVPGAFERTHAAMAGLMLLQAGWFDASHTIVDDTELALQASGLAAPVIIAIVGTGTGILGFGSNNKKVKVDGWGPVLGDDGSAYYLGTRALRAIVQAADGRQPKCPIIRKEILRVLAADEQEVRNEEDLVSWFDSMVQNPRWIPPRVGVAKLAQGVAEAKLKGDELATRIFEDAANHIVAGISTAAQRMDLKQSPPVFLEGHVIREHKWFAEDIATRLIKDGIASTATVSPFKPIYGALLLGLQTAKGWSREEAANLLRNALDHTDEISKRLIVDPVPNYS